MFSKKLVYLLVVGVICKLLLGCATTKPNVNVYFRTDVDTSKSKVIVFPMLLTDGKKLKPANESYSNPIADALFGKKWSDLSNVLGTANSVIIPKIALDKIPGANDAINALISTLDITSAIEQTTTLTKFLETLTTKFGAGAFAFALVFEDENEYKSSKQVHLNMGLFDTKKLTWKWITKHSFTAGMIPVPYQVVTKNLISESFEALKEKLDRQELNQKSDAKQNETNYVYVKVIDTEGNSLRQTTIKISQGEQVMTRKLTDENGEYSSNDLPFGTYTIKAWHKGYIAEEKEVDVSSGNLIEVNFVLKKK